MDLFFEIQRQKTHIFVDAKESSCVFELKKMIEGILKVAPEKQMLKRSLEGKQWEVLEDAKTLQDSGFGTSNAKAQNPAVIALCLQKEDSQWEDVTVESLSQPPPLPDVMRGAQDVSTAGGSSSGDKPEQTIS